MAGSSQCRCMPGKIEPSFFDIIMLYCVHMSVFPRSHHIYSITEPKKKKILPTRSFIISSDRPLDRIKHVILIGSCVRHCRRNFNGREKLGFRPHRQSSYEIMSGIEQLSTGRSMENSTVSRRFSFMLAHLFLHSFFHISTDISRFP